MKTLLVTVAMAGLLAGCATEPTPLAKATPAPADRTWPLPTPSAPTPAKFTFVRDTGAGAQDSDVTVWIDTHKAAVLRPGESATFEVAPGNRQVTADHSWNALKVLKPVILDNRAEPGEHLVYRVGFESQSGTMRLVMHRDLMASTK